MLVHVVGSEGHAINTQEWVLLLNLHFLDFTDISDWVESGVLGESHWDLLESIGESSNGVLLNSVNLVGLLGNLDGTSQLGSTTSSDNIIILDHVSDNTDGIEEASLGLVANGSRSTSDKDGNGLGVVALLDKKDLIVGCTEREFLDASSLSELLWSNLLESWNNSGSSGDGKELNLDSTNPSDSWELIMHEEMVSLIIETPLAKYDVGTGILALLHHVDEVLLLHIIQFFVVCSALNFKTVLGLWFWWLECAGKNENLSILNFLYHLWMREVLIENDTLNECTVFKSTTGLGNDLNEVEVDILSLEIGNMKHGLES